jgi:hypothetical protein
VLPDPIPQSLMPETITDVIYHITHQCEHHREALANTCHAIATSPRRKPLCPDRKTACFLGNNVYMIVKNAITQEGCAVAEPVVWEYVNAGPDNAESRFESADHGICDRGRHPNT